MYVTSIQQKLLVKVFPLLHGVSLEYPYHIVIRAETNTRIFALLHMYSNTKRVFGCKVNDFSALIIAYLKSLMVFQ